MIYRFGEFELNQELCQLRRQDDAIRLQRKAFDVLLYLIEHRDRVVTKDELLDTLWHDSHVSEGALTQVIKTLRHTLLENTAGADVIATIRGRGFRFNRSVVTLPPSRGQTVAARAPRPASAGELLRRLADLPAKVLCELEIAAVVGRDFGLDDLAGCSPAEPACRRSSLQHAERAQLIRRTEPDGVHFRFCHARVQRVVYASIPAARKREIHAHLARRQAGPPASTRRPAQQTLAGVSRRQGAA